MAKRLVTLFFSLAVLAALGQTEIEKLEAVVKPLKAEIESCFEQLEDAGGAVDVSLKKIQARIDAVKASDGPTDGDYEFFVSEGQEAASAMKVFTFALNRLGQASEPFNKILLRFLDSAKQANTEEKRLVLSRVSDLRTWRERRIVELQVLNDRRLLQIRKIGTFLENSLSPKA